MEATQLCYHTQRPIAHKAGGIGVWASVLEAMVLLAVLTNCAHQALTSHQFSVYFPSLSDGQKVLLIFVVEHAVLALRLLLPHCIAPVPAAVRRRMARDALALARLQGRQSAGSSTDVVRMHLSAAGDLEERDGSSKPGPTRVVAGAGWSSGGAPSSNGIMRRFSLGLQSLLTGIGTRGHRLDPNDDDPELGEDVCSGGAVSVVQSSQGTYVMGNLSGGSGALRKAPRV